VSSPISDYFAKSREAIDLALVAIEAEMQANAQVLALSGTSADTPEVRRAAAAAAKATDLALEKMNRALRGQGPVCL
jgi:hypothetical protein